MGWRDRLTSREMVDREYNAVAGVPDLAPYIAHDAEANGRARRLRHTPDVAYGRLADETLDIFPAGEPDAPVMVFIHGGYWKSMHSRDFHLVANGLTANGVTVVLTNYSLCPKVCLAEITRQNRAALAWVRRNIAAHGGSPDKIFVCGHSAGGQQAAMLAATDWAGRHKLPGDVVKGVIPISGLYDLAPLAESWLQPTLNLTDELIRGQSPLLNVPADGPPMFVSVGGEESSEFRRQAEEYLAAWQGRGNAGELFVQEGRNHFTSYRDFNRPDGRLTGRVLDFMKACLGS